MFYSMLADAQCEHPLFSASLSQPVMTVSESRELVVVLSQSGDPSLNAPGELDRWRASLKPCTAHLEVLAPNFDKSPASDMADIKLPASYERVSYPIVLAPKKSGRQIVVIKSALDEIRVPITVLTDLGITVTSQAYLAAMSAVGGFLLLCISLRDAVAKSFACLFRKKRRKQSSKSEQIL